MADCPQRGAFWRGCEFRGRYDEKPLSDSMKFERAEGTAEQMKAMFVRRVYVRDVCTSCGKTIERTP